MTPRSKPLLESSKTGSALSRGDRTIFFQKQGNKTQNPGSWIPRMGRLGSCELLTHLLHRKVFTSAPDFCALKQSSCCTNNRIIDFVLYLPAYTRTTFHSHPKLTIRISKQNTRNSRDDSICLSLVSSWEQLAQVTRDFLPEE